MRLTNPGLFTTASGGCSGDSAASKSGQLYGRRNAPLWPFTKVSKLLIFHVFAHSSGIRERGVNARRAKFFCRFTPEGRYFRLLQLAD
jgi:hypothetical protein